MRKFKTLATLVLAGLVVGCSSSNKDIEESNAQDLYSKGQTYLQDGDYNSAIRYLEGVGTKGGQYTGLGEQTQLSLIYAQYKVGEYYKALDAAERFARSYPNAANMDYVFYLAGLSNARLGDNFIQDFFGVNRAFRAVDNVRNAYGNFQTIVQHYPQSQYAQDAQNWMNYLFNRLAEHELSIVKFYDDRNAYVAVVNRIEEMLRFYPNTEATKAALPYLKEAYKQMGIQDAEQKTDALIQEYENKTLPNPSKPKYGEQF
ncbi:MULTISPECIES: outer membrane protein assembly factor BamD [unclassified Mannheimia]|uniref:outer membrane protein assembly factor BamD n=1 Tax=unclassified Mannheimia TaxID=2645054 RepID=UPI00359DCCFF